MKKLEPRWLDLCARYLSFFVLFALVVGIKMVSDILVMALIVILAMIIAVFTIVGWFRFAVDPSTRDTIS